MNYTTALQNSVRKLFSENKIDLFLGYQAGPEEANNIPLLITDPKQIEKLIFTGKSIFNLVNYLKFEHAKNRRVGIVVKGCDSRALNLLLTENQVKRENVHVIGVACSGVTDEAGKKFQNCEECVAPNPVLHDELLGEKQPARAYSPNADVVKLMEKNVVERGEQFQKIFESCIRCNACRNSCPLCYCAKCSIEENSTFTCDQANTLPNAGSALLTWSLHLAGRCVDCRNCEKACPRGLPLHLLHKKNEMVVHQNFAGHLAGCEDKDPGALYKYDLKDPESFIM